MARIGPAPGRPRQSLRLQLCPCRPGSGGRESSFWLQSDMVLFRGWAGNRRREGRMQVTARKHLWPPLPIIPSLRGVEKLDEVPIGEDASNIEAAYYMLELYPRSCKPENKKTHFKRNRPKIIDPFGNEVPRRKYEHHKKPGTAGTARGNRRLRQPGCSRRLTPLQAKTLIKRPPWPPTSFGHQ
ncbi:hypothetical protein PIB30_025166 [Stylosanthes scabra]|uniref:Uncharacterized protein n=1 Tax=Stylosanthes scabra TaxID=79078 RepID=A0ABU6Y8D2_9FABA|nr:hypothetical protein [Stylosanthes scabra]